MVTATSVCFIAFSMFSPVMSQVPVVPPLAKGITPGMSAGN